MEVAAHPEVVDPLTFEELYRRIGVGVPSRLSRSYDTEEAQVAGRTILRELTIVAPAPEPRGGR